MPRKAARHEAMWMVVVSSLSACILPQVESSDAAWQAEPGSAAASQPSAPASPEAGATSTTSAPQPPTTKPPEAASATRPKVTPAVEPPPPGSRMVPDAGAHGPTDSGATTVDAAVVDPAEARADAVALEHAFATWPMPDSTPSAKSMPSYSVGDMTVTDNVTHLVWQRNIPTLFEGCTGTLPSGTGTPGEACSWSEAKRYCGAQSVAAALGGAGWRVPTKIELESLIHVSNFDPAIDTSAFPARPGGFWTATPAARAPKMSAWFLNTTYGYPTAGPQWAGLQVRCVR